ncbi:MAG TPA: T9SS type A sorting domain-containing protein [Flavobacteriaceae bacterium]
MKKITFLLIVLTLAFSSVSGQTVFDWDTNAVDNGDNVTETIDGITVTFSGGPDIALLNGQGSSGTSGLIVWHSTKITSVTFTFDQPVNVNSILPIDAYGGSMDYTFTPTGGANSAVVASIVGGVATTGTVDLNWVGVTSFTVTASDSAGAGFGFDNLSVSSGTLSVTDAYVPQNVLVYPNPVANTLYIKNILDLKSINIYNNLGQLVLQSKEATIDVSQLSKGMYVLQIHTNQGTETKRIIKK